MIYLDSAASTIVKKEVLEAYNKVIEQYIANPNSIHSEGSKANRLLQKARENILSALNVQDRNLIFTSGATEANNLAIKGYCLKYKNRGNHIIVSSIEHASVLETAKQLETDFGFDVTYLKVNEYGIVTPEVLKSAMTDKTILVSIMAVNNEIGAINPINELAKVVKSYPKAVFHVDAVQAIGKLNLDFNDVDMFSYTGHKIGGLNGCGCLIIKKGMNLLPILSGGGQEGGLRSGTNDLASAVALCKATQLVTNNLSANYKYIKGLYDYLYSKIDEMNDYFEINSFHGSPYILNFSSKNKKASVIVEALSNAGIMVSSISACHSRSEAISYVVLNMGKSEELAHNTIRVSLNENITKQDIDTFLKELKHIVEGIK